MAKLDIKATAKTDLTDILTYSTEQFGEEIAEAYLRGISQSFDRLRAFPEIGTIQQGVIPPTRCLLHRSHRIFYRYNKDTVSIIRILHKARESRRWLA